MSQSRRYDFSMDYKDISERIALLTQEIRDLQEMTPAYPKQSESNQRTSRASREARELRLRQIKEELSSLMPKPTP
jgi:uncharacterized small protein (DUF1192 family)